MISKIEQGKQNRAAIVKALTKTPQATAILATKSGLTYDTAARHLRALGEQEGGAVAQPAEDDKRVMTYVRA